MKKQSVTFMSILLILSCSIMQVHASLSKEVPTKDSIRRDARIADMKSKNSPRTSPTATPKTTPPATPVESAALPTLPGSPSSTAAQSAAVVEIKPAQPTQVSEQAPAPTVVAATVLAVAAVKDEAVSSSELKSTTKPPYLPSMENTSTFGSIVGYASGFLSGEHSGQRMLRHVLQYNKEDFSWENNKANNDGIKKAVNSYCKRGDYTGAAQLLSEISKRGIKVDSTKTLRAPLRALRTANNQELIRLAEIAKEQLAIQTCIDASRALYQDEAPSDDESKADEVDTLPKQMEKLGLNQLDLEKPAAK